MNKECLLLDVFTDTPFTGNQLAVFPSADDLWLRERGVKKLGFSVCESRFGDRNPGKCNYLVVCFNHECKENKEVEELFMDAIENICKIQYIAREVCNLDIFMEYKNTDPIEMKYKNIGILK